MDNNKNNYCTLTRFKLSSQQHDEEASKSANNTDNETALAHTSPFISAYCTAKRQRRAVGEAEINMGSEMSKRESINADGSDHNLQKKLMKLETNAKRFADSDLDDEDNEYVLLRHIDPDIDSEDVSRDSLEQSDTSQMSHATFIVGGSPEFSPVESLTFFGGSTEAITGDFSDSLDMRNKPSIHKVQKSSLDNVTNLMNDESLARNIDLFNNLLDNKEVNNHSTTQYCTLRKTSPASPTTATETDNKTIGKYCTIKLNNKQLDALHVTEHDNIYENKTLEFYLHDLDNYLNEIEEEEISVNENKLSEEECDISVKYDEGLKSKFYNFIIIYLYLL